MSARDYLQPHQMKLFMTARELMDIPAGDSKGYVPMSQNPSMSEKKLQESKTGWSAQARVPHGLGQTLHDSIKEKGVIKPVLINTDAPFKDRKRREILWNGHHRVVSAHDIDPDMYIRVIYTPIEYTE